MVKTFDEWWHKYGWKYVSSKDGALEIWKAAQEAEREACAKVAESAEIKISVEVWMGAKKALTAATAIGIAAAIRARVNNGQ